MPLCRSDVATTVVVRLDDDVLPTQQRAKHVVSYGIELGVVLVVPPVQIELLRLSRDQVAGCRSDELDRELLASERDVTDLLAELAQNLLRVGTRVDLGLLAVEPLGGNPDRLGPDQLAKDLLGGRRREHSCHSFVLLLFLSPSSAGDGRN